MTARKTSLHSIRRKTVNAVMLSLTGLCTFIAAGTLIYILGYLANNPNKDIPTRDLVKALTHKPDANSSTVAGTLGAFGRRVKNRHKRGWPMSQRWDEGEQCCFYRMPKENADKIQRYLPTA